MRKKFSGIFTALVTPFKRGNIDYDAFSKFVEWQIQQGVQGLVVAGTTGEAHSLTEKEYKNLINLTLEVNNDRLPVIVGVPSNSTAKIISIINKAKCPEISGFLVSTPYYLRPTQEGMFQHFKAITEETNSPIVVYNVPHRCSVELNNETILKIMELPNIVAVKDATGDLEKPLIYRMHNKKIALLSGNDTTYLNFKLNGGDGCISVASNILPAQYVKLHNAVESSIEEAQKINEEIFPLVKALFCESNPIPIKYALSLVKKYILPEIRLPLTEITENNKKIIQEYLAKISSC